MIWRLSKAALLLIDRLPERTKVKAYAEDLSVDDFREALSMVEAELSVVKAERSTALLAVEAMRSVVRRKAEAAKELAIAKQQFELAAALLAIERAVL